MNTKEQSYFENMKNRMIYWAGILALLCTSCTDEPLMDADQQLRITGHMDNGSRTTFIQDGDVTHTHWEEGDRIGLYTDKQTNLPYQALSSGATTEFQSGTETLERKEGDKVWAYYPYKSSSEDLVSLPYTLSIQSDKDVPVFLYSDATIRGLDVNFQFKHLFAYLRITVSAELFRTLIKKHQYSDELTLEGSGIYIKSTEAISSHSAKLNPETMEITNGTDCMRIVYQCPDIDHEADGNYTYMIPMLPQSPSAEIKIMLYFYKTENDNKLYTVRIETKNPPTKGIEAGYVYVVNYADNMTDNPDQREILTKLYQTTGGNQWNINANWLSESSLNEWYGINTGNTNYSHVHTLDLPDNNLTGQLPAELAGLMDKAERINLEGNLLTGDIPDEIKNHEKWPTLGWGIINQNYEKGGGFNLANSGLYADECTVTYLTDGTSTTLDNVFARNKLTQVITLEPSAGQILRHFDATRVNHHLDYQSKGLGTVIFTGANAEEDNDEFVSTIQSQYAQATGVSWLYGKHFGKTGYSYFYDTQGQLVHIAPFSTTTDNEKTQEKLDAFLRSTLGAPASHQEFQTPYYTSTDYSMDGEVYTIQKATEGNGIDIILMGEGFTDKHMEPGGRYEAKMMEATEKIFSIEPYKSLRNRFNVIGVKVVSPNAEFTHDGVHAINKENTVALSYAALTGTACPLVAVIYNTEKHVERSYCQMYWDSSCVAYCMDKIDGTMIHELCGHGISWIADEYVESGNEKLYLPDEQRKELVQYYWPKRWVFYGNVDCQGTASTVRWAHILSDNRYADENLGIYEGALYYAYGIYRSNETSIMRNSNLLYFNAPSRELIYKAVMMRSEGDSWLNNYDYEEFVAFDEAARKEYAQSRSLFPPTSDEELRIINSRHRPPTVIEGSWRDELKKVPIRDPLR